MEREKKWYLIRLGDQSSTYQLKNGITLIGRNRKADVITISDICSRKHCTITCDANELTLKNLSDNGTYINEDRVDECKLKEGDKIGLGCDYTILTLQLTNLEKYYVFELVTNFVPKPDIIVSDEEDEIEIVSLENDEYKESSTNGGANEAGQSNNTNETSGRSNRDINSTSNNKNLDASKPSTAIDSNRDNQATNESPILNISDCEDENEFHFSQQCVMQIKQEVHDSDKTPNLNDDFQIKDEADDDDDYSIHDDSFSNWCVRLSQNQDYAIKKVQQSIENKKRRAAELIEAVPEKKRKRSQGEITKIQKTNRSHTNSANAIANDKQVEVIMTISTSDLSKTEPIVNSFDRITVKEKNSLVPCGEISNTIEQQKKKIRVAHNPKTHEHPSTSNSAKGESSRTKPRKKKKRVRFADDCGHSLSIYKYFEAKEYEDNEILIAPTARLPIQSNESNHQNESQNCFENDPLHEILTDITEWRTDWITKKLSSPPMNDFRSIVPIMDVYIDFKNYKEVIIPLLKHELWSSIVADTSERSKCSITIDNRSLAKRASRNRYLFNAHVTTESISAKVFVGDFVIIESNNCPSFFAYVTGQQFSRNCRITYFTMEASEAAVNFTTTQPTSFYATPIANIRSELKQFSAILYLGNTPFKDMIINPVKNPLYDPKVQVEGFEYTGYDPLNANQLEILKKIQTKCCLGGYNLSLIEGPPGTGKTRLITGIILQLLFGRNIVNKLRILVLTSSNAAIDIIARRLIHIKNKMEDGKKKDMLNIVRYGILKSMHPQVQCVAPQNLQTNLLASPPFTSDKVKNLQLQRDHLTKQIESDSKKNTGNNSIIADRVDDLRKRLNHVNSLIKEYTGPDDIKMIMRDARVVCSTLSSAINIKPYVKTFDVCIIDEASQCTESWSMVPLQYQIHSFILVGDSKQLSPVVLSQVCRENGMERSLFTRLFDSTLDKSSNKYSLTTQYRMHPEICLFPNKYFYEGRLRCAEETNCDSFKLEPYIVFSLDFKQSNRDAVNYHNSGEAQFIVDLLKVLEKLASPLNFSYGLITPYAKQKAEIQQYIQKSKTLAGYDFPVNTIDSYQGQEKDIIILSTARTTGVGFLANPQRLNVALTRAKKCLIICGNFTSVANIRVWKELLKNASERNKLHAIPNKYDFEMIANIIRKNQSRAVEPTKPN